MSRRDLTGFKVSELPQNMFSQDLSSQTITNWNGILLSDVLSLNTFRPWQNVQIYFLVWKLLYLGSIQFSLKLVPKSPIIRTRHSLKQWLPSLQTYTCIIRPRWVNEQRAWVQLSRVLTQKPITQYDCLLILLLFVVNILFFQLLKITWHSYHSHGYNPLCFCKYPGS